MDELYSGNRSFSEFEETIRSNIMKFKKIKILGFKSFVDQTDISIEEGLDRNCWP